MNQDLLYVPQSFLVVYHLEISSHCRVLVVRTTQVALLVAPKLFSLHDPGFGPLDPPSSLSWRRIGRDILAKLAQVCPFL